MMRTLLRLLAPACVATGALVVTAAPVFASQPLSDANVQLLSLKVNGKGEALVN